VLARRGLCWLLRWREPPCGARRRGCCLGRRLQVAAVLAQRRQRWLLRWRELPCGAGRCDCCLARRWLQGPCRARSTRAALASTLALATRWPEAARVLPRAMASRSMPCSLDTGNAGFLRWREPPCGARRRVCCLGRRLQDRCCARSTQATLASTLVQATLWRGSTRLLLRAATARSRPCSLDAGSAGF